MESPTRGRILSKLPTELIEDILSWLQVKALFRFKRVSREWRGIITSPTFIKLHCERSNSNSRIHLLYSLKTVHGAKLHTLNLNSEINGDVKCDDNDYYCSVERLRVTLQGSYHKEPVGSCNGLVCLRNVGGWGFTLLNPSTRTHVKLPNIMIHKFRFHHFWAYYGFGYDDVNDDYKVVKIEQTCRHNREKFDGLYATSATVYSWRKNQWRTSQVKFDCLYAYHSGNGVSYNSGVPYNNALHWLALTNKRRYVANGWLHVVAFNLCTGEFDRDFMSLPIDIGTQTAETTHMLALLKGCLHLVAVKNSSNLLEFPNFEAEVDLWVMKDYSTSSWCRLAKIVVPLSCPRLITYSNMHKQIVFYATGQYSNYREFLWADLHSGRERVRHYIPLLSVDPFLMLQPYVESLVTLESRPPLKAEDDVIKEARQEIQRCRAREKHLEAEIYSLLEFIKSMKKDEATESGDAKNRGSQG